MIPPMNIRSMGAAVIHTIRRRLLLITLLLAVGAATFAAWWFWAEFSRFAASVLYGLVRWFTRLFVPHLKPLQALAATLSIIVGVKGVIALATSVFGWVRRRRARSDKTRTVSGAEPVLTETPDARASYSAPAHQFVPRMAPPLPSHFIERPEITGPIKAALIKPDKEASGRLLIGAIHGLGGIGKSTIATYLAWDAEVRKCFPDGTLWATLGQDPQLLKLLTGWIRELGDYVFQPADAIEAKSHLVSLLTDRTLLIVIDDAWDSHHVDHFLVAGGRSRIIVTTREHHIASHINATPYDVHQMSVEQSMDLLRAYVGELPIDDRVHALDVCELVDYLPQALELAAVQIREGITWPRLRTDLQREVARLKVLDGAAPDLDEEAKRYSLQASFSLSLRRLNDKMREQFAWLGIIFEDSELTARTCAVLWDVNEDEALEVLNQLRSKALILDAVAYHTSSVSERVFRVHDLINNFARSVLSSPKTPESPGAIPGLGLRLDQAHAQLLYRYRARCGGRLENVWSALPNDAYIHSHLTLHLIAAGLLDELHAVFVAETEDGKNACFEGQAAVGNVAAYLDSIHRAQQVVRAGVTTEIDEDSYRDRLDLELRYALVFSSITSWSTTVSADLVTTLVRLGYWPITRALGYAEQVTDANVKAVIFSDLLRLAPDYAPFRNRLESRVYEFVNQMIYMSFDINGEDTGIGPIRSLLLRVIQQTNAASALSLVWPILNHGRQSSEVLQAAMLSSAAQYADVEMVAELANVAKKLVRHAESDPVKHLLVLAEVAPLLDEEDRTSTARAAINRLLQTQDRIGPYYPVMLQLAYTLPQRSRRRQTVRLLKSLRSSFEFRARYRQRSFAALARAVAGADSDQLIRTVPWLDAESSRASLLTEILSSDLITDSARNEALRLLARSLAKLSKYDEQTTASTIAEASARLPSKYADALLPVASRLKSRISRAVALLSILPQLTAKGRTQAMSFLDDLDWERFVVDP